MFWAPDSRRLGFFAGGKLKKIDLSGGIQTLCDAQLGAPGAWNRDGVILFGDFDGVTPAIVRISDSGCQKTRVVAADPKSQSTSVPQFLPDGRHFLFHTVNPDETGAVYLGSLDSTSATRLMTIPNVSPAGGNSSAAYALGYLLFTRERTLLAQPFDTGRLQLGGEPLPVAENVGQFSASEAGVLIYRKATPPAGQPVASNLQWLDRKGKPLTQVRTPSGVGSFRLSNDDRILMDSNGVSGGGNTDIWVIDARSVPNLLTADNPSFDGYPVWSPDASRIVFGSARDVSIFSSRMYQKSSNGVGAAELLLPGDPGEVDLPQDWSAGGIVFERFKRAALQSIDLWFLSMPDKKPFVYLHNGFANVQGQVSPDGRYMAYATNESGSYQIVVQTFPDPNGGKWPISAQGGTEPLWKRDGLELYYLAADGKIMAVSVKLDPIFQVGQTSELFQSGLTPQQPTPFFHRYGVSADGQRFLVAAGANSTVPAAGASSVPITAVVNWTATLRKK